MEPNLDTHDMAADEVPKPNLMHYVNWSYRVHCHKEYLGACFMQSLHSDVPNHNTGSTGPKGMIPKVKIVF
jgi:hypothetical protein